MQICTYSECKWGGQRLLSCVCDRHLGLLFAVFVLYCLTAQAIRLWKPAFPVYLQAAGAGPGPPNRAN